jgi:hypothetical protein
LVQEVLDYAMKLRLQHESLWVFVRTILAHKTLQGGQSELILSLRNYSQELENADGQCALSTRIVQTLDWITKYEAPADSPRDFCSD